MLRRCPTKTFSAALASILVVNISSWQDGPKCVTSHALATYNANDPTEDRMIVDKLGKWSLASVFDGHGGHQVSEFVASQIVQTFKKVAKSRSQDIDNNSVDDVIHDAFESLENEYVQFARKMYGFGFPEVAKVGCCALVALHKEQHLVIANCGDCRAVLGTKINGKAFASRLSRDHNARMPLEVMALNIEHPGEGDVVKCKNPHACYVKGRLQLTRALGDLYLKHREFNDATKGGRHIGDPYTPPYVNYVPEITHVTLDPGDEFVILASDGLWDFVSDQEAVAAVARCGDRAAAAQALVDLALERAAASSRMTKAELLALPAGRSRRRKHDDTTAVVLYF